MQIRYTSSILGTFKRIKKGTMVPFFHVDIDSNNTSWRIRPPVVVICAVIVYVCPSVPPDSHTLIMPLFKDELCRVIPVEAVTLDDAPVSLSEDSQSV